MALSWNEIRDRALKFTQEWENESREHAEAKSFWDSFFNVFGISRRRVATFEEPVKKLNNQFGFIDLFWKGTLLVEHKSKGKSLDKAYSQALDYFNGLKEEELPKYVLVSDFERFRLYDLEDKTEEEFHLKDFYKNIKLFGFVAGYQKKSFKEQDPVNTKAAELMGKLHDQLEESGYKGHSLEVYLVRLLFCLFADDTGIFEKDIFKELIEIKTSDDGSNLGSVLAQLFQVLDTPRNERQKTLDELFNQFPYINGKLFEEPLKIASFDSQMREILLKCSALNWGEISPAIFGSMFQAVMDKQERKDLGAHYTSEQNILKLIKPLFLDELRAEFEKVKKNKKRLTEFHKKLSTLKFLDPACGCGNFLVITYRELRLLELDILRELYKKQLTTSVETVVWVDVDQFYGIEYDEWPARIAEVALWLTDHQMNLLISEEFGHYFARLPLKKSAKIVVGNALREDWRKVVSKDELSFILGNPPFYGKSLQTDEQKEDMNSIFRTIKGAGVLDYVTGWYLKAAQFIQNTKIKVAFVSTNSISQGEQVGILWNELLHNYKIKIHFAHRTFRWKNEAKANAAVYVVIIGFGNFDVKEKLLFDYEDIRGEAHERKVQNINPYLVEAKDLIILKRSKPISDVLPISYGSKPAEGGNLIFSNDAKEEFLRIEPEAEKFIKPLLSAREFLNGQKRWCLWLKEISPNELKQMPKVLERVKAVKEMRLASRKAPTREWANFPTLFTEDRQPDSDYILIPSHSSEFRNYIPIGFLTKENILNNSCFSLPNATLYHFGILTSEIHMTWVKYVCGRIKGDFRYSNTIVYNNFPFPVEPSSKSKKRVEEKAQNVLEARAEFPNSSLADLYDATAMPPKLVKAHRELDKAVDLCYRRKIFQNERERIEFLFELYETYTASLLAKIPKKKSRKKKFD